MRIARISLGVLFFLVAAQYAAADVTTPCKECSFFGFCQQTPAMHPGKDKCTDTPNVGFSCGFVLPGGLGCGVQFSTNCQTSGGSCMNFMEFVIVWGMDENGCERAIPDAPVAAPRLHHPPSRHGLHGTA